MSGDFSISINKGEGITQAFVRKMQESGKIKKSKIDWNSVLIVLNDEKSYVENRPNNINLVGIGDVIKFTKEAWEKLMNLIVTGENANVGIEKPEKPEKPKTQSSIKIIPTEELSALPLVAKIFPDNNCFTNSDPETIAYYLKYKNEEIFNKLSKIQKNAICDALELPRGSSFNELQAKAGEIIIQNEKKYEKAENMVNEAIEILTGFSTKPKNLIKEKVDKGILYFDKSTKQGVIIGKNNIFVVKNVGINKKTGARSMYFLAEFLEEQVKTDNGKEINYCNAYNEVKKLVDEIQETIKGSPVKAMSYIPNENRGRRYI
jgi:hypothetical protein